MYETIMQYGGTEEEKNNEIDKIKSTILADYIAVPNSSWQLGHKNPGSFDSSKNNLVLQPPIQSKYRDNYIFIDTLTRIPVPKTLDRMIKNKEIELTIDQMKDFMKIFLKHLSKEQTNDQTQDFMKVLFET